jgi:hypothetical protein
VIPHLRVGLLWKGLVNWLRICWEIACWKFEVDIFKGPIIQLGLCNTVAEGGPVCTFMPRELLFRIFKYTHQVEKKSRVDFSYPGDMCAIDVTRYAHI